MAKMKRLLALLLTVMMLLPAFALAQEEAPITHTARATTTLKVRRAPSNDSSGGDSISRDSMVYIVEYGNLWCKVRTSHMEGYVKTQYLTELTVVNPAAVEAQAEAREAVAVAVGELQPGFTMNKSNFTEKYIAHTVVNRGTIYEEPRENAKVVRYLEIYKQLVVGEISGDWAFVCYNGNVYGYIPVSHLFKWDRIDPYAGEIPGLEIWNNLVFVNQTVTLYDINTNEELDTVNPGAAFCASDKDAYGRYLVPYDRTTTYVTEDQVSYALPVVDWRDAQPGDLISVMSTFFPVGITNAAIYGRNWNIHLSSDFLTGMVLQPGETFNMNHTIGPYLKSTGYMSAPILSDKASMGYGGGTCQVNTTFYITTVQLPLLVTHRKVHQNVGMDYAEKGFDAAVGSGDINLTMENTLPYAIRYQFMNSDGVLTCCIFRD